MKLKKKHFARLKEIALGMGGPWRPDLDALITDIESVQKPKTVQEKPLNLSDFFKRMAHYDHRKSVFNNITKEGESMVAASTDDSTEFKGGLRDMLESLREAQDRHEKEIDAIHREADEAILSIKKDAYNTEPKIGDVGYFWDRIGHGVYYGILEITVRFLVYFAYNYLRIPFV